MKKILPIVAVLAVLGCASQAQAGVHVGIGIGVPFGPDPYGYYPGPDVYYGPGYYPWYHGYWHGGYHHHYHHH